MILAALLSCVALAKGAAASDAAIARFVDAAHAAEIVVLGEIHDNPRHHEIQAEIVRALSPAALVFEMIPGAADGTLNALRAEGAGRDRIAAALDWDASGWPDFAFYAAIMEAAPEALIFGAEQPPEQIRRAVAEGAAAAFGAGAAAYGLDAPLPSAQLADRRRQMAASHCGMLPEAALPGMVEAQRLRDAGLADAALRARKRTRGTGVVVVITGTGHADRRWGAPALIALAEPAATLAVLGLLETPAGIPGMFDEMFDMEILAVPPQRADPCAAFEATEP